MPEVSVAFNMAGFDWSNAFAIIIMAWVTAIIVGVALSLNERNWTWLAAILVAASVIMLLIFTIAATVSRQHDHDEKIAALEDFKYNHIQVEGDEFIASKDGRFIRGVFIEDGDKWRIVILKGAEQ